MFSVLAPKDTLLPLSSGLYVSVRASLIDPNRAAPCKMRLATVSIRIEPHTAETSGVLEKCRI